jgi:hypothetical protein
MLKENAESFSVKSMLLNCSNKSRRKQVRHVVHIVFHYLQRGRNWKVTLGPRWMKTMVLGPKALRNKHGARSNNGFSEVYGFQHAERKYFVGSRRLGFLRGFEIQRFIPWICKET